MPTRVYATAQFTRFARKAKIPDAALARVIERAERGIVDADLGGGLVKLRVARPNEDRRSGFRTIVALVVDARAVFLFGYAKNDMDNIADAAEAAFRTTGRNLQNATDAQIAALVEEGALREIAR